jgi:hypothetical protein
MESCTQGAAEPLTVSGNSLPVVATLQLAATVRDAHGNVLPDPALDWSVSPAERASVSAEGVLTALGAGPVSVRAEVGEVAGTAQLRIYLLSTGILFQLPRPSFPPFPPGYRWTCEVDPPTPRPQPFDCSSAMRNWMGIGLQPGIPYRFRAVEQSPGAGGHVSVRQAALRTGLTLQPGESRSIRFLTGVSAGRPPTNFVTSVDTTGFTVAVGDTVTISWFFSNEYHTLGEGPSLLFWSADGPFPPCRPVATPPRSYAETGL